MANGARNPGSDLYVASRSDRSDILKIGRSGNPGARCERLQASHIFHVALVATFPGAGDLETAVHEILAGRRVLGGPGREWFYVTSDEALAAIGQAESMRRHIAS
jgi:hypothetical protein